MASPIDAQIILCDAAVADPASGKVHMLGAGWSITGSPTPPQAVAVLIKIPWDRTNQKLPLKLSMLTDDGKRVQIDTPNGAKPIAQEGTIEAGRPPGVAPGSMIDMAFALSVPTLPLPPGRYEWRLEIADLNLSRSFQVVRR